MGKIGCLTSRVKGLLGLTIATGTPICLGAANIAHMVSRHPAAYAKYGSQIINIINSPDYVGLNPSDGSVEYVKEFKVDNEFVKVAVRLSGKGILFARTIYILNNNRVRNFINKGTLKKV